MKRFPLKSPASQNGGAGKDRVHQTGRVSLNQPLGGITTQQEGKGGDSGVIQYRVLTQFSLLHRNT